MSIWKNGIMGVVVGDALGCPVQFESRAEVARHPVTGMRGFEGCESLESVKLPGGLKELGEYAFFLCDKLSSISIPEGVTRIETGMFFGCSRLRHVDIPGTVISLGKGRG